MREFGSRLRLVAKCGLLLFAGALTTVLVSWLMYLVHRTAPPWHTFNGMFESWLSERGRMPQCRLPSPSGEVYVFYSGGLGYESVQITPSWGSGVPHPNPADWMDIYHLPGEVPAQEAALYPGCRYEVPSWAIPPAPDTVARVVETHAAGWPMLALRYTVEQHVPPQTPGTRVRPTWVSHWGADVTRWFPTWAGGEHLPLLPIPLGFVVDMAFFGAVIWAMARGVVFIRAARRRRRGLCGGCGYDLRGLAPSVPCPECGAARGRK